MNDLKKFNDKAIALAYFLDIEDDNDEISSINNSYDNYYIYNKQEYLVLKDDEADDYCDEYLNSLAEDVVFHNSPDYLHKYFNLDWWKENYLEHGRGFLAGYDGNEEEVKIDRKYYYIYRTN